MGGGPGDVEGARVEEDEDDGFAGGYGGFEKLLLFAGKIEGGAGGAFAAHALEFAEDEDGYVGLLDEVEGVVELGVTLGVGGHRGLGAGELGVEDGGLLAFDFYALGVEDVVGAVALAHAFEDGDGVGGVAGEAPGAHDVGLAVGERADEGDGFVGWAEGEEIVFVAEEDGGLRGDLAGGGALLGVTICDAVCDGSL